jgi:hypothetical protein
LNLQVAAIKHKGEKNHFAPGPLERSVGSQRGPWFAQITLKLHGALQCRPRRLGAAEPVKFRRGTRRRRSGKGRSGPRESHATDLWLELGLGRHRQGGTAARRFPDHCGWVRRRGGGLGE